MDPACAAGGERIAADLPVGGADRPVVVRVRGVGAAHADGGAGRACTPGGRPARGASRRGHRAGDRLRSLAVAGAVDRRGERCGMARARLVHGHLRCAVRVGAGAQRVARRAVAMAAGRSRCGAADGLRVDAGPRVHGGLSMVHAGAAADRMAADRAGGVRGGCGRHGRAARLHRWRAGGCVARTIGCHGPTPMGGRGACGTLRAGGVRGVRCRAHGQRHRRAGSHARAARRADQREAEQQGCARPSQAGRAGDQASATHHAGARRRACGRPPRGPGGVARNRGARIRLRTRRDPDAEAAGAVARRPLCGTHPGTGRARHADPARQRRLRGPARGR